MRRSFAKLTRIQRAGCAIILAALLPLMACNRMQDRQVISLPPKPSLTVMQNPDHQGGMCLDRDDTAALARYILALESAIQE